MPPKSSPRKVTYPLGVRGKIIGRPYQGTHGKAFNVKGGSDNWESENAVDIAVPDGTPVYAVANGTIGSQIGSLGSGGRFAGLRVHLVTAGNEFYYAHLSKIAVRAGQTVKAGQLLGYSGSANGVAHLHFASKGGDPLTIVNKGEAPSTPGPGDVPRPTPTTPASPATQASATPPQSPTTDQEGLQFQSDLQDLQRNQPSSSDAGVATPPLVGDYQSGAPAPAVGAATAGGLWSMIASNGNVSPDTAYLAQLASLGQNG